MPKKGRKRKEKGGSRLPLLFGPHPTLKEEEKKEGPSPGVKSSVAGNNRQKGKEKREKEKKKGGKGTIEELPPL